MKIAVQCHAGYRGEEEPRAFVLRHDAPTDAWELAALVDTR